MIISKNKTWSFMMYSFSCRIVGGGVGKCLSCEPCNSNESRGQNTNTTSIYEQSWVSPKQGHNKIVKINQNVHSIFRFLVR